MKNIRRLLYARMPTLSSLSSLSFSALNLGLARVTSEGSSPRTDIGGRCLLCGLDPSLEYRWKPISRGVIAVVANRRGLPETVVYG
ncbi:MAG: hypothetical protein QXT26_06160 [Thermoproteota archaeon]